MPISKITQAKVDWRHGSSNTVPAWQVQIPEFKPQFYQKKKKKERERIKMGKMNAPN
jgi:hypothetical protein